MDPIISIFLLILSTLFLAKLLFSTITRKNLPPSPPSLPILGHLHLLSKPVHRALADISHKYGPVLFLRFGSRPVLLVNSDSVAEECLTKNDIAFANRPKLIAGEYLNYNYTSVGSAPYGPHWRNLRRIMSLEIFSSQRINSFASIRMDEMKDLVRYVYQKVAPDSSSSSSSSSFKKVEIKPALFAMTFNVILRMMTRKRYHGDNVENMDDAQKFKEIAEETFVLISAMNPSDYFPIPRWFDILGIEKKLANLRKKRDAFLQVVIDEQRKRMKRLQSEGKEEERKTIVDVILSMQDNDPENYNDDIIKGFVVNLVSGGVDTSALTVEWAMSLLLNNPKALVRAREEMDTYMKPGKLVEETDLPHLPYLQAIINEALRLHHPVPILLPHQSSEDTVVSGYHVPKGTMLIINGWAIQRDEKLWDEPNKFKPERFLQKGGGEGYKMIPFGFGRRKCPGDTLAFKVVGLALGALIQCFEWERVDGKEVDMTEGPGITMPKAVPLEAMCKTRENMIGTVSKI